MPIESDLVVSALDKVQIQVEEYFRATRQQVRYGRVAQGRSGWDMQSRLCIVCMYVWQVFRLDEVASYQRSAVYSQRRAFLTSSDDGRHPDLP